MRPHFEDKKLIYGTDTLKSARKVLEDVGSKNPLIATTPYHSGSGTFRKFTESLETDFKVFNELTEGPPLPEVEHMAEAYRNSGCDSIMSFGNSSVIWASKLLKYYFAHESHHLVVPTTLTVSTFSDWAEYRMGDEITFVVDQNMVPDAVILDPESSLETDDSRWLSSGLGVMDYAMSNLSREDISPATEDLLLSTLESLIINLPGKSMESRMESMISTWYSKVEDYRVGSDPLTEARKTMKSSFDVPEEVFSCLTLPLSTYMTFVKNPERLSSLSTRLGFRGNNVAELSIKAMELVRGLMGKVGISGILSDYGLTNSVLRELLEKVSIEKEMKENVLSSIFGDLQ